MHIQPFTHPKYSWITHREIEHIYVKPHDTAELRYWLGTEVPVPDPSWVRPTIADPSFVASEDQPDAVAPQIPDESATQPTIEQFQRDPDLSLVEKCVSGEAVPDVDVMLAAFD